MRELIQERTGTKGGYGEYFKINPYVSDLPEKFSCIINGVRLLTLGGVMTGGKGCICPESALLKALVTHLLLRPSEIVILDMEAGIEHLGRATAQAVSIMVIVVEPGLRSIQTAQSIKKLAKDINIPRLGVVINKVPKGMDLEILKNQLEDLPILGTISLDQNIALADLEGRSPYTGKEPQLSEIRTILEIISNQTGIKIF